MRAGFCDDRSCRVDLMMRIRLSLSLPAAAARRSRGPSGGEVSQVQRQREGNNSRVTMTRVITHII